MLFKSAGIINSVFEWIVFSFFSSEWIVNRILIVSIVVNKFFSLLKKIIIIIIIIIIYFKKFNRSLRPDSTVGEKGKKRGETEKIISGRSERSGGLRSALFARRFFFLMRRLAPGWCHRSTAVDKQKLSCPDILQKK